MTKSVAVVSKDGRVTLPEAVLRELGVRADTTFTLEVRDGAVVLEPDFEIPPEDAWAYTPEHIGQVARARADAAAGRVRQMSEADLDRLAGDCRSTGRSADGRDTRQHLLVAAIPECV